MVFRSRHAATNAALSMAANTCVGLGVMQDTMESYRPTLLWYNSGNLRFQLGGQLAVQETVQETRGLRSSYLASLSLERSASAVDGLRSSYLASLEKGAPAVDLSV